MTGDRLRLPDWRERLHAVAEAAHGRDYELGVHDCFLFGCACHEAVTGDNPAPRAPGGYRTRRDSLKMIRQFGGAGAQEAISRLLRCDPISVGAAIEGDWALFQDAAGQHIGICMGPAGIAVLRLGGLGAVGRGDCLMAWPVGRHPDRSTDKCR